MTENTRVFLALIRAGLFPGQESHLVLHDYDVADWGKVYRIAQEQSVVGLVAAGIEILNVNPNLKLPLSMSLTFAGEVLQLEQRNQAMNQFIAKLVNDMRRVGIYALLVKGQGVAQCYKNPLWRACGDVDFFLSDDNYEKAKEFLIPRASSVEPEGVYGRHLGMSIDGWVVELHGRLRCGFSGRVDRVLDEIQNETFYGGSISSWNNNGVQVFKLSKENEVFYVFAHFLGHFYKGGIGLRQICDWCRLLWVYRSELDIRKLETLVKCAGLVSEWKAFGTSAVEYLGMPFEAMPLLSQDDRHNANLKKKAHRICKFILEVGNFGHNRDMSFYREGSYLGQKVKSFGRRIGDMWNHARIFPLDTMRFVPRIMWNGVVSAVRGE